MESSRNPRLPPAFDDLDVGITLHDPETAAVLDVNDRLEELYGYSAAQLRTMEVEEYTPPSTKFSQERVIRQIRAAADGESQVFEWQVERANGEVRWVRVHLNQTCLDGSSFVVAEIHDISEYKAREQRLRLLNRIVRHNLRNDMNVLIGYADRLKAAVEDETLETTAETVLDIATEVGTMSESIAQIEEIARPDATERVPTNLCDVVRSTVEDVRAEYPDVDLTVDARADVRVVADRGVHYAITHAIENAIEHNDRSEPSVSVTVSDDPSTNRGMIEIADDGPKIPEIEIDVLDDEVETDSTYHGSGVGLWVMQWCIDSLGGELRFDENEPRGNIVRILLPRIDPSPDES